jgi:hypothetical protein
MLKFNLPVLLALIFLTSCENHDPSSSSAFQRLKNSLMNPGGKNSDFTSDLNSLMDGPTTVACIEEFTGPIKVDSDDEKLFENYKKLGGDPVAFQQAMCFLKAKGDTSFKSSGEGYSNGIKIENQRYVTINDLNKPSSEKRMFILDRQTGNVEVVHTGHGSGIFPTSNDKEQAKHFGNSANSRRTPTGFFITGNTYNSSKSWKVGMRLHGLQQGINDKSFSRGVVFHGAGGVSGGVASSSDDPPDLSGSASGRSHGCTTVNPSLAADLMSKLGSGKEGSHPYRGGSLYYNFSPSEKSKGPEYCGDSLVPEVK